MLSEVFSSEGSLSEVSSSEVCHRQFHYQEDCCIKFQDNLACLMKIRKETFEITSLLSKIDTEFNMISYKCSGEVRSV